MAVVVGVAWSNWRVVGGTLWRRLKKAISIGFEAHMHSRCKTLRIDTRLVQGQYRTLRSRAVPQRVRYQGLEDMLPLYLSVHMPHHRHFSGLILT